MKKLILDEKVLHGVTNAVTVQTGILNFHFSPFLIDTDFRAVNQLINTFAFRQFLSLIQRHVGKLRRTDHSNYTATMMLIGIPNVGKSALAKALHHVGRISAAGI